MNKFCGLLLLCAQFQWSASALTAIRVNPIDRVNKVLVDTLKTCYNDEKTIVVHSDSDESTIRALENSETFTIILYKDPLKISRHIDQQKEMSIFLTTTNSSKQLQKRLKEFIRSPWWNVMATFFILDTSNSSCEQANSIHDSTWALSIINSFFVCLSDQQEPMFHMYNPYTNRAPSQWTQLEMLEKKVSSRWTTYSRQYIQGQICDGLKFDKTKFLDGARVSTAILGVLNRSTGEIVPGKRAVLEIMQRELNVTPIIKIFDVVLAVPTLRRAHRNGWFDFFPNEIGHEGANGMYLLTYPVDVSTCKIITHKGHHTYMENIWNYYGTATCVASIFILAIIYVALIIMLGTPRRYGFVALELLRLLLNTSMISPMNNRRHKIYFMLIFFIFLVLHTKIDGEIASWMTKPVPQKPIDSIEDLYDERIRTIYLRDYFESSIPDYHHKLREKVTLFSDRGGLFIGERCNEFIGGDDSGACIDQHVIIESISSSRDDIYLAKNPIVKGHLYYLVRFNWPLIERVDILLMRFAQYGINHLNAREWEQKLSINYQRKISITPQKFDDDDIKVTLTDFMPILYVWASGIACSIVCFVIELIIGRRRSAEATEEVPLDAEFVESAVENDISAVPSCSFYRSPQRSVVKAVVHHQQQNETEF